MNTLFALPAQVVLVLFIVIVTAIAVGAHVVVRRSFQKVDFIEHNEVAGFLLAVIGTMYAVLLGFITVVVWERFNDSIERFEAEAGSTAAVWHLAQGLPTARAGRLRRTLQRYVDAVVNDELPAMQNGRSSPSADETINELLSDAATFKPADRGEANVQLRMLQRLNDIWDDRNARLEKNQKGISWFLWTALTITTVAVFAFTFLFGMRHQIPQLIMTGLLATMTATLFAVLIELNYPFRGNVSVNEDAWTTLSSEIRAAAPTGASLAPASSNR